MRTPVMPVCRRRVSGISLIEMLIALLVLSFGLLGMAGLQAYSLRNNTSAFHRSQATFAAYDLIDRMRVNRQLALEDTDPYQIAATGSLPAPGADPDTREEVRDWDLWEWQEVLGLLPAGVGSATCDDVTELCTVTVRWDDTRGVGAAQQFVVSTRL